MDRRQRRHILHSRSRHREPAVSCELPSELLALLRTYLNDPTGIRDAGISEPAQKEVGGRRRYVVCVRFNARSAGRYAGVKERAGMYVDGRLDRIIDETEDLCKGVTYAAFPEMEKLTR